LNCGTYVIDIFRDYGNSCTFDVNDLVDYMGPKPFSKRSHLPHSQILIPLQQRRLIKF